jgi:serine/threonine protein kinase
MDKAGGYASIRVTSSLLQSFTDIEISQSLLLLCPHVVQLPFYLRKGLFMQQVEANGTLPITYISDDIGSGAAATVREATIDPKKCDFQTEPNEVFAIKVSKPPTGPAAAAIRAQAERERDFQKALTSYNICHSHIMVSYTGFEYKDQIYVVSERGSGNILDFMTTKYTNKTQAGIDYEWMLQQFRGLAEALKLIHGSTELPYTGFHHDIKPQNILVFAPWKDDMTESTLKLCDWGLAVMGPGNHSAEPISIPGYWPPEAGEKGSHSSQPHDVWSLGCVFLEILVWFHESAAARANFIKTATIGQNGWFVKGGGEVSRAVEDKCTEIKRIAPGSIDLITIIRRMLIVAPEHRPTADDVVKDLEKL